MDEKKVLEHLRRKMRDIQDTYEVFGTDAQGRPPLLGQWLDERAADEAKRATKH